MRNIKRVAVGVIVSLGSVAVSAGTYDSVSSAAVGTEAASAGTLDGLIGSNKLVLKTGTSYLRADRLSISLSNGATFADGTYLLEQSGASADTSEFTLITTPTAGASTLVFRAASDLAAGTEFILSGSTATGASVAVNLPSLLAGSKVNVSAVANDVRDDTAYDTFAAAELFRYANQFSGAISGTKLNAEIDVESPASRKLFTGAGTSDAVMLTFTEASLAGNKVSLNDTDKVEITLLGDLSGANSITVATGSTSRGTATIAEDGQSATVSLSASDAYAAGSATLNVLVGSSILSTSNFTVQADLNFETETDKNLVAAGTTAGAWTINGLQAKVANVTLNSTGFITWLKVANEGAASAVVYADIIYNTYGGGAETKVTNAQLGIVAAGSVATISEASILAALNNPTGVVDASLTVTVTGPKNSVFLTAEKKASDGRVNVPVFYDNTSGGRKWFQ